MHAGLKQEKLTSVSSCFRVFSFEVKVRISQQHNSTGTHHDAEVVFEDQHCIPLRIPCRISLGDQTLKVERHILCFYCNAEVVIEWLRDSRLTVWRLHVDLSVCLLSSKARHCTKHLQICFLDQSSCKFLNFAERGKTRHEIMWLDFFDG